MGTSEALKKRWEKYREDPKIGPLLSKYLIYTERLDRLKDKLRNSENIEQLITISKSQIEVQTQIWELVDDREDKDNETFWQIGTFVLALLLVILAITNLALTYDWF